MNPCVFCDIIWNEAPATVLWRNDDALIIEPLNPVTPGHLLAISKNHVDDALCLPSITGKTTRAACEFVMLANDSRYESLNLITSVGEAATQSVFHLHIHIVPRAAGDGLHLPWTGQTIEGAAQ